jgi:homoaconitase/3-isopropylmalate dehydratase large subunit
MMVHDNNGALVIESFGGIADASVKSPEKAAFFIDHHSPSTAVKAVRHHDTMRRFAKRHGIKRFYDCGCGISHVVMLEENLARAGEIVVGTDSHTTGEGAEGAFAVGIGATEMAAVLATGRIWFKVPQTVRVVCEGALTKNSRARDFMNLVLSRFGPEGANYCSVEFQGNGAASLSLDDRIMCCVMSMEMGAKNATFVPSPDSGAEYARTERFVLDNIESNVAVPPLPTNVQPLSHIASLKIRVNQAFIGSCAGGLLSDIQKAAEVLRGERVAEGVRLLVIPASRKIYGAALSLGYLQTLHEAGAVISSPACGACGGHDVGVLAKDEVCIANSPRNMDGRMGAGGKVYLGSAATVAASAVAGHVTAEASL